jgi:tetratricopeptide (TPR) repeat protein
MKRLVILFVVSCGGNVPPPVTTRECTSRECATSAPSPGCADFCRHAATEGDGGGMCTMARAKGDDCAAPHVSSADGGLDAPKPAAALPDAPLPPPKPTTIALSRGTEDAADKELVAGDDSFEKNDWEAANRHYRAALAASPRHPGAIVGLARVRIAKTGVALDYGAAKGNKEIEAAIKDLKRAAAMDDAYGPAHVELGRALLMVGDADAAIASLTRGVELLPEEAEAHSALGIAKLATGKGEEAVSALARAAELDPGSAARHGNYGTVLLMRGRVEGAVKEYRTAVRIAPNDARTHSDLGTALLASNDVREALTELERAIALDPSRATFHSNYGYALQIKGDLPRAIAEYRLALKIDDRLASAWINLATALARDPATRKEARAALERARAIDPSDPRVKANFEELEQLEKGH